jgi:hypothetical protein
VDGRDEPGHDDNKYRISKCNASIVAEVSSASSLRPRRIIEKPLAKNLVAAPLLLRDLVDPEHPAGLVRSKIQ